MDWFLYDNGLRHERVKKISLNFGKIKKRLSGNLFVNVYVQFACIQYVKEMHISLD